MTVRGRHRSSGLRRQRRRRRQLILKLVFGTLMGFGGGAVLSGAVLLQDRANQVTVPLQASAIGSTVIESAATTGPRDLGAANGRPQLDPLPPAEEVWECEVVVVGGSLGGVAAAHHAMQGGAQTCLIELSPWLGGQVSSQGVSAIDESWAMQGRQNFSRSWQAFKQLIGSQPMRLPDWTGLSHLKQVYQANSCWVGSLCFLPKAGAVAAQQWLEQAAPAAPGSRWGTSIAFKGATFDPSGRYITAVYGVKRQPRSPQYMPQGRLSKELALWYAWAEDDTFTKQPIRLQAPPGQRLMVIDATDTGELVAWANIPHRIGSDAQALLGEANAPATANPACTQAFTFPFVLAILDDAGTSRQALEQLQTARPKSDYRPFFDLEGFQMFHGRGVFNYRRIISRSPGQASATKSAPGEMTLINWNRGNDWNIIDAALIMDAAALEATGQYQNWLGGLSVQALQNAEENALVFAEWLMQTQATAALPLALLSGTQSPLLTESGLSMVPYIREGRRIVGRSAYGQEEFMMREADVRVDMVGRDFADSAIAITHYGVDIHGCRYRNWEPSNEAIYASVEEDLVRPLAIPLEATIPIGVDNLLIGGKGIAGSHIVNAMTRTHYNEWSIGAATGATAAWLKHHAQPGLTPAQILVTAQTAELQTYLSEQGLRWTW